MLNCQTGMELMLKARLWIDNLQSWGRECDAIYRNMFYRKYRHIRFLRKIYKYKGCNIKKVYNLVL